MSNCRLTKMEISDLCQELAYLLHAGGSSADTLALLAEQEPREDLSKLLRDMANQIDDGESLDGVFRKSGCFPNYMCALLSVGVRTGRTEDTLNALARYYEGRAELDRQIRSALLYPSILLLIMLVVVVVLLVEVLPIFNSVYAELGGSLTGVAGGLLALGKSLGKIMPLLCVLLGAAVLFLAFFALSPSFRDRALNVWRKKWGNRGVSAKLNTARLAQSMAMCLSSGLPLDEALTLSADLLDDIPAASEQCKACIRKLEDGEKLTAAMGETGLLPPPQCRLLELGMKSGSDDIVMQQISERLSDEAEIALQEKVGQVEPSLVLITSVLLGLILLSVMLPLMNIMSAIG